MIDSWKLWIQRSGTGVYQSGKKNKKEPETFFSTCRKSRYVFDIHTKMLDYVAKHYLLEDKNREKNGTEIWICLLRGSRSWNWDWGEHYNYEWITIYRFQWLCQKSISADIGDEHLISRMNVFHW